MVAVPGQRNGPGSNPPMRRSAPSPGMAQNMDTVGEQAEQSE